MMTLEQFTGGSKWLFYLMFLGKAAVQIEYQASIEEELDSTLLKLMQRNRRNYQTEIAVLEKTPRGPVCKLVLL